MFHIVHQIFEHKGALALTFSSLIVAAMHAVVPPPLVHIPLVAMIDPYVRLFGGVSAACAGFSSAAWYGYCFVKAVREKKKSGHGDI